MHRTFHWTTAVLTLLLVSACSTAEDPPSLPVRDDRAPPEDTMTTPTATHVVQELYDLVSFDGGQVPDWERVRALFLPEAVIVLRTSREATSVFSVDGFVGDFVNFVETSSVGESGFTETIVRMEPMQFGDIAHVLVLYEAHLLGSERGPRQGVDSIQLVRRDGVWRIAAIVNELPLDGRALPEVLRG